MRDKKFVTIQRGGTLSSLQHRQLVAWACTCVKNLLPLASEQIAPKIKEWLQVGEQWVGGLGSTGDARNASMEAVALARTLSDPLQTTLVRAAGHAVATAHMADHCLRALQYVYKAVQICGGSPEKEKQWQCEQISDDIKSLIF